MLNPMGKYAKCAMCYETAEGAYQSRHVRDAVYNTPSQHQNKKEIQRSSHLQLKICYDCNASLREAELYAFDAQPASLEEN